VTEHDIPQERGLPAGRLVQLKEDLMAQIDEIEEHPGTAPRAANMVTHRRWRRLGLAAAGLVAALGLATTLVVGGNESASANTAERTDDGAIMITLREGKDPKALQRRLNDLGVPAVVDFLESGFGCDDSRSTGWVQQPRGEALFGHAPTSSDEEAQYVLHPDQLRAGETMVFVFQIDEHGDAIAANVTLRLSTSPVGPCEPVPDASIVDAEAGIAGG
jgi:hypothetical protein